MRTNGTNKRILILGGSFAGLALACWLLIKPILSFFSLIGISVLAILYFFYLISILMFQKKQNMNI